jgi:hypothetical protein
MTNRVYLGEERLENAMKQRKRERRCKKIQWESIHPLIVNFTIFVKNDTTSHLRIFSNSKMESLISTV